MVAEIRLRIGSAGFSPGGGSYELAGGSLSLQNALIGADDFRLTSSRGFFVHTGGSNVVDGLLAIGSGDRAIGVYEISGGMLRAQSLVVSDGSSLFFNQPLKYGTGTLRITGAAAEIHVGLYFRFGPYSSLEAVPGATIHFDAGAVFANNSSDPVALAGRGEHPPGFDGPATPAPAGRGADSAAHR